MTHQQPEVLRGDRANFSFTSLSIANILVFTAANVAGLWCRLPVGASEGIVPLISSVLLMADRQPLLKCLVLALCHNLHCIHVGSCWCLFWVCLCPWVCHWLFRGFEPWLIGQLVCTVQIRCTAGIDGWVPDCMLFISSMRRDHNEGNCTTLSAYSFSSKLPFVTLDFDLGGKYYAGLHFLNSCLHSNITYFPATLFLQALNLCRSFGKLIYIECIQDVLHCRQG